MTPFINAAKQFIMLSMVVTLASGICYVAVQQSLRQSANDPQIQMAEDAAAALARGETPAEAKAEGKNQDSGSAKIDMALSLSPFLIIFDDNGQPVVSTVQLNAQTPAPPAGVLAYAKAHGENRVTWQPRPGVRSAAVIVHYAGQKSGFVLAGRSLREVETRVSAIGRLIAAGWAASLFALSAVLLAFGLLNRLAKRAQVH
jgi:hypothetical protein